MPRVSRAFVDTHPLRERHGRLWAHLHERHRARCRCLRPHLWRSRSQVHNCRRKCHRRSCSHSLERCLGLACASVRLKRFRRSRLHSHKCCMSVVGIHGPNRKTVIASIPDGRAPTRLSAATSIVAFSASLARACTTSTASIHDPARTSVASASQGFAPILCKPATHMHAFTPKKTIPPFSPFPPSGPPIPEDWGTLMYRAKWIICNTVFARSNLI